MLLVIFIMGLLASAASMMTDSLDTQSQYEDTKRRLETIRRAIVGDPGRTVNGGPEIGGFVADVGRLPDCLQELLERVACPAASQSAAWIYDDVSGLWAGWNGPYLDVLPDSGGAKAFRDGWGNDGAAPAYGWNVAVSQTNGTLLLQSYGSDGAAGGSDYAADYPSGNLVERNAHQVNLKGWNVAVKFTSTAGAAIAAGSLRLRVYYPVNGSLTPEPWPADDATRDAKSYLSAAFPAAAQTVPANGSITVPVFVYAAADKYVPWGSRSIEVVCNADGTPYDGNCGDASDNSIDVPRGIALIPRSPLPDLENFPMTWNIP